jgi:hypothetical protein
MEWNEVDKHHRRNVGIDMQDKFPVITEKFSRKPDKSMRDQQSESSTANFGEGTVEIVHKSGYSSNGHRPSGDFMKKCNNPWIEKKEANWYGGFCVSGTMPSDQDKGIGYKVEQEEEEESDRKDATQTKDVEAGASKTAQQTRFHV